ncbi:MAG: hypothetical protein C0397_06735 [Odoribacter sp.]|nr:hypothetical protein [Odoribacter sp.]
MISIIIEKKINAIGLLKNFKRKVDFIYDCFRLFYIMKRNSIIMTLSVMKKNKSKLISIILNTGDQFKLIAVNYIPIHIK